MKTTLFLVGLLAVTALATESDADSSTVCPMVTCGTLKDMCFSKSTTGNAATIQACGSGEYCQVPLNSSWSTLSGFESSYTCAKDGKDDDDTDTDTVTVKLISGMPCSSKSDCYSDSCEHGLCRGIKEGKTCTMISSATTSSEKAQICDLNLYCDSDKCAKGAAKGAKCTNDYECEGRMGCENSVCAELGSIAKGGDCTMDMYCADGNVCSDNSCTAGDTYKKGSYRAACTSNDDCSPANCSCTASKNGGGLCSALGDGTFGSGYYTSYVSAAEKADWNCPLEFPKSTFGGCGGTFKMTYGSTVSTDSCYGSFYYGSATASVTLGSVVSSFNAASSVEYKGVGSSSASTMVSAVVAFVAYMFYF